MKHRVALLFLLGPAVYVARRVVADQYWGWRNRIWDDGWTSAWACAADHMRTYEDTPEKYVAEHGFWWRGGADR
jgi:hypothetical protein